MSSILLGIHDPFAPFENIFCALFMGGLADTIARAFGGKAVTDTNGVPHASATSSTPSSGSGGDKMKEGAKGDAGAGVGGAGAASGGQSAKKKE